MRSILMTGVAFAALALAVPSTASAQTMNPFARAEHHLGSGGTQVTIEQFAADPGRYMRPGAYPALREHIARQIGVLSLSDAEFKALLLSNRVRVVSCEGPVSTGGFRANGTVGRLSRECYTDELRVLVQDSAGVWKSGFLLGCLNPDYSPVITLVTTGETRIEYRDRPAPVRRSYRSPTVSTLGNVFNPQMPVPLVVVIGADVDCPEDCPDGCN